MTDTLVRTPVTPETPVTLNVRMTPELVEAFTARTDDGRRLSMELGEPDADGFYTPTIRETDDGKVMVDRDVVDAYEEAIQWGHWRYQDLLSCEKDDDCGVKADGAQLVLDDIAEHLRSVGVSR